MCLGLCCRYGKGGDYAKECQADSLQQKILYLVQQRQATGETQVNLENDERAYTRKEVLALPAL
jgi:UV DNA damage repair endonuclease